MWQDQVVAHCVDPVERSKDVWLTESIAFDELLLSKEVLSGLKKSGFHTPSPIQLKSIPLGRCGLGKIFKKSTAVFFKLFLFVYHSFFYYAIYQLILIKFYVKIYLLNFNTNK